METMQLVRKQCRSCGSENVKEDVMGEDGEELPILVCNECNWWGE